MTRVLAGTEDGIHTTEGPGPVLEGRAVTVPVPGSDSWWPIVDGNEVVRDPLYPTPSPLARVDGLRANCLISSRHGVFVGTSEARLLRLEGDRLDPVAAFDRVESREGWYTPWGGPPDTRSMSEGPDGTLYVNVHVGGIPTSKDGETFSPTIDVDADVHQVLAHPDAPGRAFAATAHGLAETFD